ncbi:hypothetical protein A8B78_06640 [Jannaschia sp. EhC01]|nr:hypothetical protein A8B78_06640 [Jannaschia sp. EhC01]
METDPITGYADFGLAFSGPQFALVLVGAALIRLIPLLIFVSAILKLRRFPEQRPLHWILLVATLLVAALGLIETLALGAVPQSWRTSGLWSFLWIFAVSWLAVSWTRSAIKTALRPRGLDIATLVAAAALLVALALPLAVVW